MPYALTGTDQERRANDLNRFLRENKGTSSLAPGQKLSGQFIDVPSELTDAPAVIVDGIFMYKSVFDNLMKQQDPNYTGTRDVTPYVYGQDVLNKKANDAAVRTLYKSYFNRDPSAAELKNWGSQGGKDTTVKVLEDFLKIERVKYRVTTEVKPVPENKGGTGTTPTLPTESIKTKDLTDTTSLPDHIKNDPYFKQMNEQQKALFAFQYNVAQREVALERIQAIKALEEATKLADPHFKQSFLLAQDSIERELSVFLAGNKEAKELLDTQLAQKKEDIARDAGRLNDAELEARLKDQESLRIIRDQAVREYESREGGVAAELNRTQRRIMVLSEDLQYSKEQLSLEEQAILSRQLKEYQRNLQATQEQAVDAGLGFSSIRTEAEKRLAEDLQDVSESTKRQKSRQLRDLEVSAGRDTTELLVSKQEIERKNQEDRISIARQIEQKTGFDSIPLVLKNKILTVDPTFSPIGIRGDLVSQQEQREKELAQRQKDLDIEQKRGEAEADRQAKIIERKREQGVEEVARKAEELLGSKNLPKIAGAPAPLGGIAGTLEREKGQEALKIAPSLAPSIKVSEEELQKEINQ